jgi:phosphoglycolate phosphatase
LTAANGKTPPRPDALIFDWDNTLVDTWGVIHDTVNFTLVAFGKVPWTLEEARQRVRKSTRDAFPALFGDKWEEARDVFYRRYAEVHMSKVEPLMGAGDLLAALAARGYYMGVVSNKQGNYLRAEAEHLGWAGYFSKIVGANDAARDKPAPDPIELALAPGGYRPGPHVWYIGDADIDLDCAHQAGCVPVLVRQKAPVAGEFDAYPPAFHFADCMALCKFMDNL